MEGQSMIHLPNPHHFSVGFGGQQLQDAEDAGLFMHKVFCPAQSCTLSVWISMDDLIVMLMLLFHPSHTYAADLLRRRSLN